MTQTNALPAPHARNAIASSRARQHYDVLMNLVVVLLAPMFLAVSDGDADMARLAAIETVNAYRARHHADLIAIAQIIAFGLAALYAISLSMMDDLPLQMTLSLHRNANALNRSAEQNRRAIRQHRDDNSTSAWTPAEPDPPPEDPAPPEAAAFLTAAAADALAAESQSRLLIPQQSAPRRRASPQAIAEPGIPEPAIPGPAIPEPALPATPTDPTAAEKRNQAMWAIVMVKEASELTASLPNLPPEERRAAEIRIAALGASANEILTGVPSRPVTPATTMNRLPAPENRVRQDDRGTTDTRAG